MRTKIIVSDEKYTTKLCSFGGHYNDWIKAEKKIKCKGYNKEYDSNMNASRGIWPGFQEKIMQKDY